MTPSLLDHAPAFTPAGAAALVRDRYGLDAELRLLPSERDQNFLVSARDGAAYVLKIANALEDPGFLAGQNRLLAHLADAGCPVPRPVPAQSGETIVRAREGGTEHLARLVTWLPGTPLGEHHHHDPDLLADLGAQLGRMDRALAGFDEPALHRDFHWDLPGGFDRARALLAGVADPELRTGAERLLAIAAESTRAHLPRLRRSIIHGDANDYNVLVSGDRVTGLIDFGDAIHSWTAGNLAVAVAYAMLGKADPLAAAAAIVRGYCAVFPLTEDELAALWGLALLRLALSVGHAAAQRAVRPGDPYLAVSQAPIRSALPLLTAIHPRFAEAVFRHAAGLAPVRSAAPVLTWLEAQRPHVKAVMQPDPRVAPTLVLDWGIASPMLSGDLGVNTEPALTARVTAAMQEAGADVGIGRYDEPRLLYSSPLFAGGGGPLDERRTVHIGLDLFAPPGTPVLAPLAGRVHTLSHNAAPLDYGPVIILEHTTDLGQPFFTLYGHLSVASLAGLTVGAPVVAGQQIATLGDAGVNGGWTPHLHVQLILDLLELGADYPGVCRPGEREVWKAFSPDPNLVLGIPAARFPTPEPDLRETLAARQQHLGGSLSVAYRRPLKIVRGYGQHLWDHEGRRYLDAYNNVPHVGHCHPRVVAAGQRQMALLNTNTRYLHDLIHQFAAELTATLPPALEVCWFLNSASEANELALRLARARTGRREMIVLEGAYHGHTTSLIDLSPYKHGGPGGEGPPDWVHVVPLPDRYRGRYRGEGTEVAASYARHVEETVARLATGRGVAGFMAETCPSVGGQIVLPEGYLAAAYRAVRAGGGVCIADEVQTGYGRIGTHFWAFLAHDVVPDIVVMGKPMGNGHPLAAVVATREIAGAFDTGMEFFSTFGGNPVSCAIGLEVLRVTQQEKLQAHALAVGERLLAGLRPLMDRHALVGDVRGSGLFLGVELVTDRNARTPAGDEASRVVNRMRDLGILLGTDGPDHNVVKIRPPMPFSADDADRLVAALDQALSDVSA